MKKILILCILICLVSCNTDQKESVKVLRERYPNDSIMTTYGDNSYYVVDSVSIKKITFSRWNSSKIVEFTVLRNVE